MIRKYNKFVEYIKEEAGIRNIRKIISDHKEQYGNTYELWFHQDLDGVFSAISMREYLSKYGMELVDSHIIQYGDIEYAIDNKKGNNMCVLVDYANFKTMFTIATDHHQSQSGEASGTQHTKTSRSNAETISGEISNTEIFTREDIKLVQIIDSADFYKNNINVDEIQNAVFSLDKDKSSTLNRQSLGFVVNRLILALKNKRISGRSLDGKRNHVNKNLLECLVMDSSASVYSLFLNLKNYINNFVSLEWDFNTRSHNTEKKMITPEELNDNISKYILSRQVSLDVINDDEYNIVIQDGIGDVFKTGSYDRYVVFKNNIDTDFLVNIFSDAGLIQVSCNPFKDKVLDKIDLGNITKEVLTKLKPQLSKINISLSDIKSMNESLIDKMYKRYGKEYDPVGFKYEDLLNSYSDVMIYLKDSSDSKSVSNLVLSSNLELSKKIKECFSKLYKDWTLDEKNEMSKIKIPILNIILRNSGGHASITNIQGLTYLSTRKDLLTILFKTEDYKQVVKYIANTFVEILKEKIDAGGEVSYNYDQTMNLGDSIISENYEYYISDNGNLNKVSKDYFIKNGINLSTNSKNPIDNSKIFKIDIDDKKVIGHFV